MKKSILALSLLSLVSSSAFAAESSLTFSMTAREYIEGSGWQTVYLPSLNTKLAQAGLPGFKPKLTFKANESAKYAKFVEQVEKAGKKLNREIEVLDKGYLNSAPTLCYNGKPEDVLKIVQSLTTAFHEDMGIQGVRYKNKKVFIYDQTFENDEDIRQNYEDNSPEALQAWKKYKTTSDAVLILSDFGPEGDGTELFDTEIKRCL